MNKLDIHYDVRDFEVEVIQKSFEIPVLVDFWADWCAPCRMLSPVLERLAEQYRHRWVLAKVNTEDHPAISAEYHVSSIPSVKLFFEGKVIGEFVGALPEYQILQWLQKTLPSKNQKLVEQAQKLLLGQKTTEARKLLEEIIKAEPDHQQARVLLAQLCLFSDSEKALNLVENIVDDRYVDIAESIRTFIKMFQIIGHSDTLPDKPVKGQYMAAVADVRAKNFDQALGKFIHVIRADRYYDDDGSRKACIAIFRYLGEDHEITQKHRRDFSSALYV